MKIQRILIDGGFTCPNRDGTVGLGGCTFCRNDSFAPDYCRHAGSITEQIQAGKKFFKDKYRNMQFLAYFQSYSGSYAPIETLRQRYNEALSQQDVTGIIIGTRPDCLQDNVLDLLTELSRHYIVEVEIGVESCHDRTLQRINRGHTWQQIVDAVERTSRRSIPICAHMIIGLPGENEQDILSSARLLSGLPIQSVKLHQLQILKDTAIAQEYASRPQDFLNFHTAQDYITLVHKFIKCLRSDIKVERIVSTAPSELLISPRWGLKPHEIQELFRNH